MVKEKRELREKLRREIGRQYAERIGRLEEVISYKDKLIDDCQRYVVENRELRSRNAELEEKVRSYEDWIERLQEFVNMSDEDREHAVRKYKVERSVSSRIDEVISKYGNFFDMFNIY